MRLLWLVIGLICSFQCSAQYPSRAITMLVGYPPGGGTDIIARRVARRISESLDVNILVDNRPGATGVLATNLAATSLPDGYTILMGHIAPNAIDPGYFLEPKTTYKWDFECIALVAKSPEVLVVHPDYSTDTIHDLIKRSKATNIMYGSDGVGSLSHLQTLVMLNGDKNNHVPYKGASPQIIAIATKEVHYGFVAGPPVVTWIQSGKLKALAQTSPKRIQAIPNVPTMAELGFPDLTTSLWWGVFAPRNTPKPIVNTLNKHINESLLNPADKQWAIEQTLDIHNQTPEEFCAFVEREKAKWHAVGKKYF